jgi:hypothetical protein
MARVNSCSFTCNRTETSNIAVVELLCMECKLLPVLLYIRPIRTICITYAISITYAMFVTGPPAQQPLGPTVQQQPTTNESWRYDAGYLQGKEDAKLKGTHTQEFLSGYAKGIKEYFTPGNCIRRSTEGNSYARVHVWIHQWDSRLLV